MMLVPNSSPQGYKAHVILFITFTLGEGVNIIDWIAKTNFYVHAISE